MPAIPARLKHISSLVALALFALLIQVGAAWSHASLNATDPVDGAIVEMAPQLYSLTFSEPVSPLTLRLVQPDGSSIPLDRFVVKNRVVEIENPGEFDRGTYVLTWRVVSADGHPVAGSVVFSIGEASVQASQIAEEIDWRVRGSLWLSKVALYAGLFVGIGGVFARRILMPGADAGNRIMMAALVVGAAGTIVSLGFQGLDALGAQSGHIAEPIIWSTGFGTSYGSTVVAALTAFALAGGALTFTGLTAQAAAVTAVLLAGTALALSGHASTASPQWLMRPVVFLHVVAIAAWIGALAPLGLALRNNLSGTKEALRRFSRVIPAIVAILILTGIVLVMIQVQQPAALLETAYGQVFLAKLVLLAGLFVLAAINRCFLTAPVKAGDPVAIRKLVRSIAGEALMVFLIFGAVAAWRFTPPPRTIAAAAAVPATTHIRTANVIADLMVMPGRAGSVDVKAVLMTSGFELLDAMEVTFIFSNSNAGIEPFRRKAEKSGDGTWRANDVMLSLPGKWNVRVDALVSDYEIVKLEGRIVIRP